MTLRDIFNNSSNIDFRPSWKFTLPLAGAVSLISAILIVVVGFNLSIDFEGGGIYEVQVPADVTVESARSVITETDVRIQIIENADGDSYVRVQTGAEQLDNSDQIISELVEVSGRTADEISINEVGPTWGDQITNKALRALVLFFIAVAVYLSLTLEWEMAVGAIVAVIHDLLLTAGVYVIVRFEVSPATVIALLTIMGYSLYDTVVVYDKVKENEAENTGRKPAELSDLVNTSMNQVLMRSINTTLTTVLPVVSMLVIGGLFLGGATLRDFALALFIGLLAGTYSSIFVASPLLVWLKQRMPEKPATDTKSKPSITPLGPTGLPR
ncbi:MAG: protein translocase subunit SecF [Acidimicrobiales bacterium]